MSDLEQVGKGCTQVGASMMGCGCLLTLLVTVPLLMMLFLL